MQQTILLPAGRLPHTEEMDERIGVGYMDIFLRDRAAPKATKKENK